MNRLHHINRFELLSKRARGNLKAALVIIAAYLFLCPAIPAKGTDKIVLYFDPGEYHLSRTERHKILDLGKYQPNEKWRLVVEGYSDDQGDPKKNLELSRLRAMEVKNEIVAVLEIDPVDVFTLGHGETLPEDGKDSTSVRALNRRVEITLLSVSSWQMLDKYQSTDPNLPEIDHLFDKADQQAKKDDWAGARGSLEKAAGLGGKQYSRWHSIQGIIGFYTGMGPAKMKSFFRTAIILDPDNVNAREYLARLEAGEKFANGNITPHHGRTIDDPIRVDINSQAHDYLRLFGVQPQSLIQLDHLYMYAWDCKSPENETTRYYFKKAAGAEVLD
ncbi:MAG: OmpA family protein [Desulfobacteraceae bacterium]|nr:OmpA family protein [Desulfobacteraceae bacterium]